MNNYERTLLEIIKEIIPKKLQSNISLESNLFEHLGFDSIKLLSMSVELENRLNFDIFRATEEIDFSQITTVRNVLDLVIAYQKNESL